MTRACWSGRSRRTWRWSGGTACGATSSTTGRASLRGGGRPGAPWARGGGGGGGGGGRGAQRGWVRRVGRFFSRAGVGDEPRLAVDVVRHYVWTGVRVQDMWSAALQLLRRGWRGGGGGGGRGRPGGAGRGALPPR